MDSDTMESLVDSIICAIKTGHRASDRLQDMMDYCADFASEDEARKTLSHIMFRELGREYTKQINTPASEPDDDKD